MGYSGPDGGPCAACAPGSAKAGPGDASCAACPANTYQNVSAATACVACVERCTLLKESRHDNINNCLYDSGVCLVGPRESQSCVTCVLGKFEDTTCQACANDSFADSSGAEQCGACPADASTYEEPRVRCYCDPRFTYMCNAGYHHGGAEPAFPCLVCVLDHYQDDISKDACKQCPPHTHTLANTNTTLTDCLCYAGFSGPLCGLCTACAPGNFKAGAGDASCAP